MKDFKKSLVKAWLTMATLAVAVLAMLHFNTKSVEAAGYTSFASFKSAVEGMRQGATLDLYVTGNFTFTSNVNIKANTTVRVYVKSGVTVATNKYHFVLNTNSKLYLGNSTYTGTISSITSGAYTNCIAASASKSTSGTVISIGGGTYTGNNQDDYCYLFNVSNGKFSMSGGTIQNAHSGVQVARGTFSMSGGTIRNMFGSNCVALGVLDSQEEDGVFITGNVSGSFTGGTLTNFKLAGICVGKSTKASLV